MTMRAVAVAVAAMLVLGGPAAAQSIDDIAGWIGLTSTPVGGGTPVFPAALAAGGESRFGLYGRWAHWQFDEDDDNTTNLGGGVVLPAGPGQFTLEFGLSSKADCDECDGSMFGLSGHVPLVRFAFGGDGSGGLDPALGAALEPAIGLSSNSNGDSDMRGFGAAVSVPVFVSLAVGPASIAPFVSPGYGWGRISTVDAYSGTRFMIGGGVAVAGMGGRVEATLGFRRVEIEEAPTVVGVVLTVRP